MKPNLTSLLIIAGLFTITLFSSSCAKPDHSADLPKEQQIIGEWYIARVQLRLYSGNIFIKDTIIPNVPRPKNFVRFETGSGFEYKYNMTGSNKGEYTFSGLDSIISITPAVTYRWKLLMLTKNLLTTSNTSTNNPAFPGLKVETYNTLTRN